MKINKIHMNYLRNDAHFQFHTYCLNQTPSEATGHPQDGNLQNLNNLQNKYTCTLGKEVIV